MSLDRPSGRQQMALFPETVRTLMRVCGLLPPLLSPRLSPPPPTQTRWRGVEDEPRALSVFKAFNVVQRHINQPQTQRGRVSLPGVTDPSLLKWKETISLPAA